MNGTMTREEVSHEVDERLRMVNSRLTSLEALKPKAAMIAKAVDGHHHMETVELFDEGTSQGFGYQMDFTGAGVTATRSGRKHSISIPGGGAGGTIIFNEDTVLVGTGATLNFTEPDATLLTIVGTTVTANTSLYSLLGGRVGGQTIIGGTADNTYLSLRGNSVDLTDPVKLLSPLQVAASPNNTIQDSGGTVRVTLATSNPHILLGPSGTAGVTIGVQINDQVNIGASPAIGASAPRLRVSTWPNLGAGNATLLQVNFTGSQTATSVGFRAGFAFLGAYDIASFSLDSFYGVSSVPVVRDAIGGGVITTFASLRGGVDYGSGGGALTVTAGAAFDAITPIGDAASVITTHRGGRIRNQGAAFVATAVGLDVEAQSTATVANIGVRIALGATYSLQLSDTGGTAAGGIQFGTDLATLYRSAANTVKTDGDFVCRTVNTGNGALEVAAGQSIIDFGAFPGKSDTSLAVTGQTGIAAGSIIEVNLTPVATADHTADEHLIETLRVFAGNIVVGNGFTIYGVNDAQAFGIDGTRIYGKWTVNWQWN